MHASSNFVVIWKGSKKDRKTANEMLQEYFDDELEDKQKLIFEETYELVWLEDIIDAFNEIAETVPKLNFVVSGYIDCSENSGEFMDFGIIYKNVKLTTYYSDWLTYDDIEINEDGEEEECFGRCDRFLEMQEADIDDINTTFKEICQEIKDKKWSNVEVIEIE